MGDVGSVHVTCPPLTKEFLQGWDYGVMLGCEAIGVPQRYKKCEGASQQRAVFRAA